MINRIIAVLLGLAFVFMVVVDVVVLTSEGSIRWGIFILYLIGTVLLGLGARWFWRRGGHGGHRAASGV